jgi:hypothetical protein
MAQRKHCDRKPNEGQRTDIQRNEYGLDSREYQFCLFMLACQCKKPKWSAGKAGYHGDLGKRARTLLDRPQIQEFLAAYAPPLNRKSVKSTPESIIHRLEQIASGEGLDKTIIAELKAIELMGKNKGMWEGQSEAGRDRLHEIQACIAAGPIERGSLPCSKCQAMCPPTARFCPQCGTEVKKEGAPVPQVKKKAAPKEVIQ